MPEANGHGFAELQRLARHLRGSAGSLRAAAEALAVKPAPSPAQHRRLVEILVEEATHLSDGIERLERFAAGAGRDTAVAIVSAADLVEAISRSAGEAGLECSLVGSPPHADLIASPAALAAATRAFLAALRRETALGACALAARVEGHHLLLDVSWEPSAADLAALLEWQGTALDAGVASGPGGAPSPGLRAVARELDGEAWFNLDRDARQAHVRVLLPLAAAVVATS